MDKKRAAATAAASSLSSSSGTAKFTAMTTTASATTTVTESKDDPLAYNQERDRFFADLERFHDVRGTSITRWPFIGGKAVDLYALYTSVTQRGGWEKVSNEETWPEVQEILGFPRSCGNIDYGLRQIYIRYLHYYEKINHFGQDPDSRDDTADGDDSLSSRRKPGGLVSGVSFTYNYMQHNMPESMREALGLSRDTSKTTDYASLERSLMSGLPNEVDFAMNVCLLLSSEGKHILRGAKGMRVVDCMLSHVGICRDGVASLKSLADDKMALRFLRFWNESIEDRSVKELVCPESLLLEKGSALPSTAVIPADDGFDDYWVSSLGRNLGMQDAEGQRVMQLIMILRNLSFEEDNLDILSTDMLFFRFLMLCIHNRYGCIRQLALDTLSNIALKMTLEPVDCRMTQLVLKTITRCLASNDKLEITAALEALGRLCQVEVNEDALCGQLEDGVYERMVSLLTLHDIQIVVAVLEALYQLSELGSITTTNIAQVTAAVSILVSLLTLEVQAYGPESLAGSKIVEHITVTAQTPVPSNIMGPPLRPPAHHQGFVRQPTPSAGTPGPVGALPVPRPTAMNTVSGGIAALDNEAVVCNWLRVNYEHQHSVDTRMSRMEMYRRYVSTFGSHMPHNILSLTAFSSCIRTVFPSIENDAVGGDENLDVSYKGIVLKSPVFPTVISADKALLSASAPVQLNPAAQQVIYRTPLQAAVSQPSASSAGAPGHCLPNYVNIQQALLNIPHGTDSSEGLPTPAPDSGLVKTLLATRVANHMAQQRSSDAPLPCTANNASAVVPSCNAVCAGSESASDVKTINPAGNPSVPLTACDAEISASKSIAAAGANHIVSWPNHISDNSVQAVVGNKLPALTSKNGGSKTDGCISNSVTDSCANENPVVKPCLSNGRATMNHVSPLINGICSPVPSCSSDDLDPLLDVKQHKTVSADTDVVNVKSDEAVITNGSASPDEDHDDDSSDLNDCDDVLCKAMIQADIIDGGGRPAQASVCDEDSQLSSDFLSGFLTAAADANATESNSGYDLEAATAVADLLNESGMGSAGDDDSMKDINGDAIATSIKPEGFYHVNAEQTIEAADDDTQESLVDHSPEMLLDPVSGELLHSKICSDTQAKGAHEELLADRQSAVLNHPLASAQMSAQRPQDDQHLVAPSPSQSRFILPNVSLPISFSVPPAVAVVPSGGNRCLPPGAVALQLCSSASTSGSVAVVPSMGPAGQGQVRVSSIPPTSQLQNNVMIVPPRGITLPSGQFVSGGTRLLIRPATSVPPPAGVNSLAWNRMAGTHIQLPPSSGPGQPVAGNNAAVPSGQLSTSVPNCTLPAGLPPSDLGIASQAVGVHSTTSTAAAAQAVRFVSTTSQGQLIIQRAQLVGSQTRPGLQRVILPQGQRPIVIQRPEGQVILQPGQPSAVRPVLLQRPLLTSSANLGPFRLAGHGVQLVSDGTQQPRAGQILLQNGQIFNVPGQPATQVLTQSGQVAQSGLVLGNQITSGQMDTIPASLGQTVSAQNSAEQSQEHPGGVQQDGSHLQASHLSAPHGVQAPRQFLIQPGQVASQQFPAQGQPGQVGSTLRPLFSTQQPIQLLGNSVQLTGGCGLVQTSSGGSVIFQQGGRQILLQPSSIAAQRPPGYVMFRPGPPVVAVTAPDVPKESSGDTSAGSDTMATSSSVSTIDSRKRPLPSTPATRSMKKKKKAEDEAANSNLPYLCEWAGCHRGFSSFMQIYQHVTKEHFEGNSSPVQTCRWTGCDSLARQRWSFMTHMQDRHLNESSLRLAAEQRRRIQEGAPPLPPPPSTPAPVYPANAALQAIRRFSARPPFPELMDPAEGPLTKHIRLTAALILRNLARYSPAGRSLLKRHEQLLSYVALSAAESSLAISHCLYELHVH